MTRLVQLQNGRTRRVAAVDEPRLRLLGGVESVYALVNEAIAREISLTAAVRQHVGEESIDYDAVYGMSSDWALLPPIDHPDEPARCLVSGTGLTHLGSAKDRDAMHAVPQRELSDSMRMFRLGLEGGRPVAGQ